MNLKRNITFQLESRKKNGVLLTENVPIRMRVVFDGKRIEFTTGYRIDAAKWDRVKNGCTNKLKQTSSEINADLNRYEGEIQNIFKEFELREIMPLPEQVKEQFNARIAVSRPETSVQEAEPQRTFWDMYDEFTSEVGRKNDWTTATYEKFSALKNHLLKFKRGKISFDTFTDSGAITLHELVNELFEPWEQVDESQHSLLAIALQTAAGGIPTPHVGTSAGGSSSDLPWNDNYKDKFQGSKSKRSR